MNRGCSLQIYWANAMFSMADRNFNAQCAEILRKAGHRVFLPQEVSADEIAGGTSPTAEAIFRTDTREILNSSLLVACVDQETIDCGVACEVGIAFAHSIPIIGLYTDIRQHRKGPGKMYKNPYVVGGIEAVGEFVSNMDDLLRVAAKYVTHHVTESCSYAPDEKVAHHFGLVASRYSDFVKRLESWYVPPWSFTQTIDNWCRDVRTGRILEFGCGTGDFAKHISNRHPGISYLGYDESPEMILAAQAHHHGTKTIFTSSWEEVKQHAKQEPFDIALVPFVLHDHRAPQEAVTSIARCLRPNGTMLVADLSTWDLPRLTGLLRRGLARPFKAVDNRIDPGRLTEFVCASGTVLADCRISTPRVCFPSASDIDEYLEIFGIYRGMDIPLDLREGKAIEYRQLIRSILDQETYPFDDQRAFMICTLKKQ